MPRGGKGTGKAAAAPKGVVAKKAPAVKKDPTPTRKERKAYPSIDERIALADVKIGRLAKTIASRKGTIEKAEAVLNMRKAALAKNTALLEKLTGRKEKLTAAKNKPAKTPAPKLSPEAVKARRAEALAKARAVKKAEKEKYDRLLTALKESGKSVDDLLKETRG